MLKFSRLQLLALKVKKTKNGSISDVFEAWGLSVFLAAPETGQEKVHIRKTNQNNCSVKWHKERKSILVAYTNDRQVLWTFSWEKSCCTCSLYIIIKLKSSFKTAGTEWWLNYLFNVYLINCSIVFFLFTARLRNVKCSLLQSSCFTYGSWY